MLKSTSALGTAVPAGKILECFDWQFAINGDVIFYTPTGHKYPTTRRRRIPNGSMAQLVARWTITASFIRWRRHGLGSSRWSWCQADGQGLDIHSAHSAAV